MTRFVQSLGAGARQVTGSARRTANYGADYEEKIAQWNKEVRPAFSTPR